MARREKNEPIGSQRFWGSGSINVCLRALARLNSFPPHMGNDRCCYYSECGLFPTPNWRWRAGRLSHHSEFNRIEGDKVPARRYWGVISITFFGLLFSWRGASIKGCSLVFFRCCCFCWIFCITRWADNNFSTTRYYLILFFLQSFVHTLNRSKKKHLDLDTIWNLGIIYER